MHLAFSAFDIQLIKGNEEIKHKDLQSGDYLYWKRWDSIGIWAWAKGLPEGQEELQINWPQNANPHHSFWKNSEVADFISLLTIYFLADVKTPAPHAVDQGLTAIANRIRLENFLGFHLNFYLREPKNSQLW